jgi:acyl-coenzyme A thioesterase PaaI-like protein
MANKHLASTDPAAQAIRARVLRGIALNRNPGLHFAGHFLGFEWGNIDIGSASIAIADGPHCHDADGHANIAALALLADMALSTCARRSLTPGARLATMHMQIQLTGAPATGRIVADSRLLGFSSGIALRQFLSTATLRANDDIIAHASGEFAALDPPPGVTLAPLPWQQPELPPVVPLDERGLEPHERAILKACDAALARATKLAPFIQHFWSGMPKRNATGASSRIAIGPHIGNRVGHVQGGISLGIAATSACAAAPPAMTLTNVSAWYIGPGHGKVLRVSSRVLHAGRTIAVVRTEIKTPGGERVLEVVSHHVARL